MRAAVAPAITAIAVAFFAFGAAAAPTQCPEHFLGGAAPDIVRPAVARSAVELRNRGYAVAYSPLTNGPLASAEHLTAAQLEESAARRRVDRFRPDPRLPDGMQMRLADFAARGICLDRGHMANDKDRGDQQNA